MGADRGGNDPLPVPSGLGNVAAYPAAGDEMRCVHYKGHTASDGGCLATPVVSLTSPRGDTRSFLTRGALSEKCAVSTYRYIRVLDGNVMNDLLHNNANYMMECTNLGEPSGFASASEVNPETSSCALCTCQIVYVLYK